MENKELQEKYDTLQDILRGYGSAAVAFSGGVDSTFLLRAAHEALGDKTLAVTACSASFPARELKEAENYCEREGIRHITVESEELSIEGFSHNPTNRCYLCKHELFSKMKGIAAREGLACVAEGSNLDDNGDYRPGLMAIAELGIKSPLREAGLTKADIRALSRELGLPTWNKQSFACLASRFPYGETIDVKHLGMVDKAEQLLLDLGFTQVRVRIHGGNLARIEVRPDDLEKVLANREEISQKFKRYGFTYVSLDLTGYRTGSMNETLGENAG